MKARPVEQVDDTVRAVAARMIELMHEVNGAGLAAPQVGLDWRMFVVAGHVIGEEDGQEDAPDQVFVNPTLTPISRDLVAQEEGCLSLPGITVQVRRPSTVRITARTLDDEPIELTSDDFLARVWQHEYDHLEGVLIIDRMSPMDRIATRKVLKEMRAGTGQ